MAGPSAQRPIGHQQHEVSSALRGPRHNTATSSFTTLAPMATHSQQQHHYQYQQQQPLPPPPSSHHHHHRQHSATNRNGNSGIAAITAAPIPTGSSHDPQQQHIEIGLDTDDAMHEKDVENGDSGKRVRHRSHHRRPLFRRVFNYLRHAWTGVKFSSSTGNFARRFEYAWFLLVRASVPGCLYFVYNIFADGGPQRGQMKISVALFMRFSFISNFLSPNVAHIPQNGASTATSRAMVIGHENIMQFHGTWNWI